MSEPYYKLENVLPSGRILFVRKNVSSDHSVVGIVTEVAGSHPLVEVVELTKTEMRIMALLLDTYPQITLHESVINVLLELWREAGKAKDHAKAKTLMYTYVDFLRGKLHSIEIEITAVTDVGYTFHPYGNYFLMEKMVDKDSKVEGRDIFVLRQLSFILSIDLGRNPSLEETCTRYDQLSPREDRQVSYGEALIEKFMRAAGVFDKQRRIVQMQYRLFPYADRTYTTQEKRNILGVSNKSVSAYLPSALGRLRFYKDYRQEWRDLLNFWS